MTEHKTRATFVHPVLQGWATYYPESQAMGEARVEVTYPSGREREALAALRQAAQNIEGRMGPTWNAPGTVGADWGR